MSAVGVIGGGSGGGGGGTWGSITGTLASQTDLQTALDAKVPNTGTSTIAGVKTFSSAPIFSALTASTIPYLNASKALTDSGITVDNTTKAISLTATGTWTQELLITGTFPDANSQSLYLSLTGTTSSNKTVRGLRIGMGSGSYTTSTVQGIYALLNVPNTGNTIGGYSAGIQGTVGAFFQTVAGTSGLAVGVYGNGYGSKTSIGGIFHGIAADGTSPRTFGVHCFASGENSAQKVAVYGKIAAATSSVLEASDPGVSAGGVFSNGDTTNSSIVVQDDSVTVWEILNGGAQAIHNNAALAATTNSIQVSAVDTAGGNRTLAIGAEQTVASETLADSTHSWTVNINNAFYKLMLVSV